MANTVTALSYANTFGDWLVATDALIGENNTLAESDYSKDSGTLYLSESTKSALQSNGNVIVQKALIVQGIGSYASIEKNLDVQGQAYFTNSTLGIVTTGNTTIGKTLEVLGSGNSLLIANNAIIGGNVAISFGTITRTLQANNTVNTSNASIVHSVYANKLQANTSILTDVAVANSSVYTNYLQANTYVLTQTLKSNNEILTTGNASVTETTYTKFLQANSSTNTSNASIVWTLYANVVQANTSVNTSNVSVVNTTYTKFLQANSSTNTSNASIVWTLYANSVQANATVNTKALSVTGNTFTNVLQANTSANTETLSVTGTSFTNVLQANSAANTRTMSVTGTTFTDTLQANTSANTRTMSVTGTTFTDTLQANSAANTRTMSVTGTTFTDRLQANSVANTETMSVTGNTFTNVLQANTSVNTANISISNTTFTDRLQANSTANTRTMSVTGTTHTNILIANTYSSTVNTFASDTTRANTIYANTLVYTPTIRITDIIDANDAAAYFNSVEVDQDLSIGGNFVINGKTIYNVNEFTLSASSPSITSFFSVYRTNNALQLANSVYANAQIRWNEARDYFDIKDVATVNDYYRIITEQQLSSSTTSTSTILAASSLAANTLNNNIQTANTFLNARIDTADSFANGAFVRANSSYTSQNISGVFANSAFTHANASFAAANNVGPQIVPAFNQANAAFNKANSATSEFIGTTGSISPNNASITLTSNNGISFYATSANTFAVSTSQDLRISASPTFSSLVLTSPLTASSGGTGSTSLASAFNNMITSATGGAGISGYVLATGGAGNYFWTSAPSGSGGGATPGTRITSNRLSYSGDSTTTLFATPTFSQANQVRIYINGVRQLESEYTLNSATSRVVMTTAPYTGDTILIEVDGFTTYEYYANNIVYGPATGALTTGTIQSAIDGLESAKMPKSGGTFTGQVIGVTPATASNDSTVPTTAFVKNALNVGTGTTYSMSISGNAGTVTNGVYTSQSYANPSFISSLNAGKLSGGTIGSAILGGSTLHVGTTAIALNRGSAGQTLTGVSIDGNAGTVGSLSVHAGRNNEANKIVRTDGNGYIMAGYINSNNGNENNASSPPRVWGTNGGDDYMRTYQTASLSVAYAANAGGINSTRGTLGYSLSGQGIGYGDHLGPQVLAQGNGAAGMSFHRPGQYAINFGLDTDNQLRVGGWSRGGSHVVLDSGNYNSYVPSLTGAGASGNWNINAATAGSAGSAGSATTAGTASFANLMNPLSGDGNYKLGYTADGQRTNAGEWGRVVMRYAPNGQTYGVRVDRADYADSAGSATNSTNSTYSTYARYVYNNGAYSGSGYVEPSDLGVRYASSAGSAGSAGSVPWTGVSGRPTNVSSFNNDSGYVTSASVGAAAVVTNIFGDYPYTIAKVGTIVNLFPRLFNGDIYGQQVSGWTASSNGFPGDYFYFMYDPNYLMYGAEVTANFGRGSRTNRYFETTFHGGVGTLYANYVELITVHPYGFQNPMDIHPNCYQQTGTWRVLENIDLTDTHFYNGLWYTFVRPVLCQRVA